jgi:hypothetical protein
MDQLSERLNGIWETHTIRPYGRGSNHVPIPPRGIGSWEAHRIWAGAQAPAIFQKKDFFKRFKSERSFGYKRAEKNITTIFWEGSNVKMPTNNPFPQYRRGPYKKNGKHLGPYRAYGAVASQLAEIRKEGWYKMIHFHTLARLMEITETDLLEVCHELIFSPLIEEDDLDPIFIVRLRRNNERKRRNK